MKMRIVLVDDHKVVRDGVKLFLQNDEEFSIVGEAGNAVTALSVIQRENPDVVLMDLSIGEDDGIELTRKMLGENPDLRVVALTMHNDYQYVQAMLEAGAKGYVLKNCDENELREALRTVMNGDIYYGEEVTKMVMNNMAHQQKNEKTASVTFTPREKEVYKLILQELTNQEIADKLFISVRTVEVHKRNLMEKTGAKSSTGLVLYAVKNNLFDHP